MLLACSPPADTALESMLSARACAVRAVIDNTCVFRTSYASTCNRDASFQIGGNRVFSQDGTLTVCGGTRNFSDWQAAGHDTATTLASWPADEILIEEVRAILGL